MRVFIISFLLFTGSISIAQEVDSVMIDIPKDPRFGEYNRPYLELKTTAGGASRQWTSTQMLEFFYGDFVDEQEKAEMMDNGANGLSLGSVQNWDIRFVYSGHYKSRLLPLPMRSIYMYNRSYTTLELPPDLLRLFLYGNRATAGVEQDIGDFSYQSWFFSGIGHQMTFMVDTFPVSFGLSLVAAHTLDKHQINNAGLRTRTDGSALEFNGQYNFGQSGAQGSYGITGWGLSTNIESAERFDKHEIRAGIYDFGVVYMPDWNEVNRDSSFVFEGLDIGSILDLSEDGFSNLLDSLQDGVVGTEDGAKWQLLPFNLRMNYRYHIDKKQFAYMDLQYLYLPNYRLRATLGYGYAWKRFEARSGFGYGGFNGYSWNLALNWKLNKYLRLQGGLTNMFGIVTPALSGGTIGHFSIRYYF